MSFRLSDDQYHQVRAICLNRGIANISELVRAAVSQFLQDQRNPDSAAPSLDVRVGRVERQVETLTAEFDIFQRTYPRSVLNCADSADPREIPASEIQPKRNN